MRTVSAVAPDAEFPIACVFIRSLFEQSAPIRVLLSPADLRGAAAAPDGQGAFYV
eukprot:gene23916-58283_t